MVRGVACAKTLTHASQSAIHAAPAAAARHANARHGDFKGEYFVRGVSDGSEVERGTVAGKKKS